MKIRTSALIACLAGATLVLGACQSEPKAADTTSMAVVKADNTMCPVAGGPISDKIAPVAYNGKNVGFCCAGCKGKFEKMADAEKTAMVASMK